MGAAESNNVSEAVTNVSNFVNNSTTANSSAISQITNDTKFEDCKVNLSGNLDVNTMSKVTQRNNQIIDAKQDSNVLNNIQQQSLQQASSKVGSLGIGYASASNAANQTVNATNSIINGMLVSCNQLATVNNQFTCSNSLIKAKNLKIDYNNDLQFLSEQTLNNTQVASIVNDIKQTIDQRASATVEGFSGMLLLVLLMIGFIIYLASKPLSSGGFKFAIAMVLIFVIFVFALRMYISAQPPFFSPYDKCISGSSIGRGADSTGNVPECVEMDNRTLKLAHPPLRYIYGVSPFNSSQPGGNLLQMVIAKASNQTFESGAGDNGGYRADVYDVLNERIKYYKQFADKLNIPNIPNPLDVKSIDNQFYLIPNEYKVTGNNQNSSICTPNTVGVNMGDSSLKIPEPFKLCPNFSGFNNFEKGTLRVEGSTSGYARRDFVANLNVEEWRTYLNPDNTSDEEINKRSLFARFVLCDMLAPSIDLNIYISDNELVKYNTERNEIITSTAAEAKAKGDDKYIYQYRPFSYPGTWSDGIIGPGILSGNIGYVQDTNYKIQSFLRKWILIILGICILGIVIFAITFKERIAKGESLTSIIKNPTGGEGREGSTDKSK
jgi:hypothetical protein